MRRIHWLLIILGLSVGLYVFLRKSPLPEEETGPAPPPPLQLVQKYGPKLYSQGNEELIIRDFFQDRRGGVFVDVGASHYKTNSTTYYLEERLEWTGIAVDAICDYGKDYEAFRKGTRFFCFFVSDRSDQEADFFINPDNKRISTGDPELAERRGGYDLVKVPKIALNDLLGRLGVVRFDLLSMDVEFSEPEALAGFDIDHYQPSLVCIEAHRRVRKRILDYFEAHRYRRLDQYDIADHLNYYFTPQSPANGKK